MKEYKYKGKYEHFATIRVGKEKVDLRLVPGEVYSLPEDHEHIKSLASTKLLEEVK